MKGKPQKTFGGVLHDRGIGGNADRENTGHVDTDILFGKRALQIDADGKGRQIEESIFLQEGKDETDAAVHALGASGRSVGAPAHLTVYDKDLVGRTGLDSGHDDEKQHHEDKHGDDDENDPDAPACRE